MKLHFFACTFVCSATLPLFSASVSAPSGQWTALPGNYDFLEDQQTGLKEGDIVGSGENQGFFVTYNPPGSGGFDMTTFGFRLRLDDHGGNGNSPAFNRAAWLGIDADMSGSVDVFLGINMSGNSNVLGIFAPGTGANTSPSSTSISSSPFSSYAITPTNYNYRPVDYLTDGGTTNDLTPGRKDDTDYYLSVLLPFADIALYLAGINIQITDASPLRFVVASATQGNSLNQDLGGVNGGVNSTTTWEQLGGFSPTMTITGTAIPEPDTVWLGVLGLSLLFRRSRAAQNLR